MAVAVLLPAYLTALGFSPVAVGVLAAPARLRAVDLGGWAARDALRPRQLLAAAGLMFASGTAFAVINDFAVLLIVAFAGTINPSAGSVSVFVPLEHAVLAGEAAAAERTKMFALQPDRRARRGRRRLGCGRSRRPRRKGSTPHHVQGHVSPLRGPRPRRRPDLRASRRGRAPRRGSATWTGTSGIVIKLAALFSLDAFAGGFVVQSLLALWLFEQFELSLAAAGVFFFWSGVLSAFSFPVAAWLSRHIGLVNTMVFTHIPSSLCLMLAAAPTLPIALALLLLRAALSQMDVPTRSSYVMALVTVAERAAAASFTSVPRSLAAAMARRSPARCFLPRSGRRRSSSAAF